MKELKSGYIFLSVLLMIALSGTFAGAEYHHVEDCIVCHYSGAQEESSYCKNCSNDTLIRYVINTPNSGLRAVIFLGSTGANSYADGDSVYDGVCEVCHTQTLVHTNTDDGVNHFDGSNCIDCHPHTTQPDLFSPLPVVGVESHDTHIGENKGPRSGDCTDCHLNHSDYTLFTDGEPLASTTACDDCHSPGGAFGGVAMAKANSSAGIYETDGATLQSGKEQWCAGCHDDVPAYSKADDADPDGVNAPNVIGDNTDYGFYVTGHKINCLSCHDAGKNHIDHEHRTYESALDNYQAGYRLRDVRDGEPMDIPNPSGNPEQDFPLCFACHNSNEVLGDDVYDVSHTNFWDDDDDPRNTHRGHLYLGYDSDWDGAGHDSSGSCVSCHNVHGAPNGPMVRHGELISTYGTTDKVPSLDFGYVTSSSDPNIDPDATLMDSIAGMMSGPFNRVCGT